VQIVVTGPPAPLVQQGGAAAGESEALAAVRVTRSQKLRRVVRRGLRYTVSCESECHVSAVLGDGSSAAPAGSGRRS
jgi:hypothetical protein